jgi:quercetin dioxygenase-like cupin family protein
MSTNLRDNFVSLADRPEDTDYAPTCEVSGLRWTKRLSPDDYSLWLRVAALENGATMRWSAEHGDEVVYVSSGALRVGDVTCPEGGTVIVESGVAAEVHADDSASIVHFGPASAEPPADGPYGAPSGEGHGVHVVGPRGRYEAAPGRPHYHFYADSTCPTCRATLLCIQRDPTYVSQAHQHTTDELIYLLRGSLLFGKAHEYGPGTCLAIPGNLYYNFHAGRDGFTFLNYRRDASRHIQRDGGGAGLEAALAQGAVEVPGEHVLVPWA